MKIKLLHTGGYQSLANVKFPVVVNGFKHDNYPEMMCVEKSDMVKHGADMELKGMSFIVFYKGEYESLPT